MARARKKYPRTIQCWFQGGNRTDVLRKAIGDRERGSTHPQLPKLLQLERRGIRHYQTPPTGIFYLSAISASGRGENTISLSLTSLENQHNPPENQRGVRCCISTNSLKLEFDLFENPASRSHPPDS